MNDILNNNTRVRAAIKRMRTAPGLPPGYWDSTLAQRLPGGAGSTILGIADAGELERELLIADWAEYSHLAVMAGCTAFATNALHGTLGVIPLEQLDENLSVVLDDRKKTGNVSCAISLPDGMSRNAAGFVVIILGDEGGEEVVFTLHPGPPCPPSTVKTEPHYHGAVTSVKHAKAMGLTTAKLV